MDDSLYSDTFSSADDCYVLPTPSADLCADTEPSGAATSAGSSVAPQFDPVHLYMRDIAVNPLLTADEEIRFGRLVQQGDSEARRRMIVCNLRLVVKVAKRYKNRGMPLLDLIADGNVGLIHAVEKFDPERGFRFSTYAIWWIRQAIERGIMNTGRTIRIPIHRQKELYSYLRTANELRRNDEAEEPNLDSIAGAMDRPVESVRQTLELASLVALGDISIGGSAQSALEQIPDQNECDPLERLQDEEGWRELEPCLAQLSDKERVVLERRFGLNGGDEATLHDIAKELGISRERVRQIQIGVLTKLRALMEAAEAQRGRQAH